MSDVSDHLAFNHSVIEDFRANDGKTSGPFAEAPLLLLTTTGAKSGEARTSPLVHTTDGDEVVIIASKAGAPAHPDWYRNIVANPNVTVELPGDTFEAVATIVPEPRRTELYDSQAAVMPNFAEYAKGTTRTIPVVVLTRKP